MLKFIATEIVNIVSERSWFVLRAVDFINFEECTKETKENRPNIQLNKRCQTTLSEIISIISADRLRELAHGRRDAVVLGCRKKGTFFFSE